MGYAIVPDINDEAVVCPAECQHTDCAENRKEWTDAKCGICGKPMFAGQAFFMAEGWREHPELPQHVHAACLYDQVHQESAPCGA